MKTANLIRNSLVMVFLMLLIVMKIFYKTENDLLEVVVDAGIVLILLSFSEIIFMNMVIVPVRFISTVIQFVKPK